MTSFQAPFKSAFFLYLLKQRLIKFSRLKEVPTNFTLIPLSKKLFLSQRIQTFFN